jgi:hypothetical protein
MAGRRWTANEDAIVKANSTKAAARLLTGRTAGAVGARRLTIGAGQPLKFWTKAEDRRISKTAAMPVHKLLKRFKNRSAVAIRLRRQRLGFYVQRGPVAIWKGDEVKLLKQLWPTSNLSKIKNALPRHPARSICWKATILGLHKATRIFDPNDLLEQIKLRLHEDRISSRKLSVEIGCGESFLKRRANPRHDFNKIAKAVEFFGGRLVIDWCDE